ncbi:MAG: phosphate ABC transporter substrate-binding protein [Pirellulales bacterium]|nr:phosphate ABC transporter substrate-binding protein [Pirellulales bacterium]
MTPQMDFSLIILTALVCGCGDSHQSATAIRNEGSDTMVNIAQAWAEEYNQKRQDVKVQVLGGGSGVGIASLIDGNCDMANTSRKMKPDEVKEVEEKHAAKPQEIIVGYDALAIYVHKGNPLDSISLEELADLYGENGTLTKWSELELPLGSIKNDRIVRINRQSSSGTYFYFRETVLGKGKDMKLGSVDANGSKDAVSLISRTPGAIGYSGMGYATDEVKMLLVSRRRGELGVAPTLENARNGTYPITRPLQIYVIGKPTGAVKEYLDWILSPEGQEVVLQLGYVPLETNK